MPQFKAGNGKWYEVITQSEKFSCGMACSSMVMKMVLGYYLSEKDCQGVTSPDHANPNGYDTHGTSPAHIVALLKKFHVTATRHSVSSLQTIEPYLKSATAKKPVIFAMHWAGVGGGHMVVSPGLHSDTEWIALDPGAPGMASTQSVVGLPAYKRGQLVGNIDAVIVT